MFETKNLVCVPLIVRSEKVIGALQVLNKKSAEGFVDRDEVIVFDPWFVMYKHLTTLAGGKVVQVSTYPDFHPQQYFYPFIKHGGYCLDGATFRISPWRCRHWRHDFQFCLLIDQ